MSCNQNSSAWAAVGVALLAMSIGSVARGDFVTTSQLGATLGPAVTSAPGHAINLDYRAAVTFEPPLHPIQLLMRYQTFTSTQQIHIQLSGGSILSYAPASPSGFFVWYDPLYFSASSFPSTPNSPMPDSWRTELADGVLTAGIWTTGTAPSSGASVFALSVSNLVITPEPVGLPLALAGATLIAVIRRRRPSR